MNNQLTKLKYMLKTILNRKMMAALWYLQGKFLSLSNKFYSAIYIMTLGLIGYTVYIVAKSRWSIRDYIPVSFSDEGDDEGN